MIRTAPQRSHVSRCPPSAAVRQVAIARSARCCTDGEPVRASIGVAMVRARCPPARAEDGRPRPPCPSARRTRSALRRRGEARQEIERRVRADLACDASIESSAWSC